MDDQITKPAIKGLIISLALIIFSVIILILKQEANRALSIIPLAILFGGVVWACLSYAKQMKGNVTFGNIFSHGFKTTALIAGVMSFWVFISLTFIFPEAFDRMMDIQREAMEKKGVDDAQIEKFMEMGKKITLPMAALATVVFYLVVGAIAALLGSSVAKKNPNPTPFNN